MAGLRVGALILVITVAGTMAGPVGTHKHKHAAHAEGGHEQFKITVSMSSGKQDPSWIIDNDTTNKDIITLMGFLREIAHGMEHNNKKYTLPNLMGYRGMEVHHSTSRESHSFVIPRCKFLQLEYLLVNLTARNAMNDEQKSHVFGVLKKCLKEKKAAEASKPTSADPKTSKAAP